MGKAALYLNYCDNLGRYTHQNLIVEMCVKLFKKYQLIAPYTVKKHSQFEKKEHKLKKKILAKKIFTSFKLACIYKIQIHIIINSVLSPA